MRKGYSFPLSIKHLRLFFHCTLCISLVGDATVSLLRFCNAYVEAEGIRLLQVLLANVVRCPSHPRTTALDAGHPMSGIWKQGYLHDWQPHHTSASYLSSLPSTRLNTSFPSPPGYTGRATNYVIRCAHPRGGANTHTHQHSLYSPGLLTRMREPAPRLEKGNTSAQHELRACARRPR